MPTDELDLLISLSSKMNVYWNFYIVILGGFVGAIATDKVHLDDKTKMIFTVIFILFVFSHLSSILHVIDQRQEIIEFIIQDYPKYESIATTFNPLQSSTYVIYHLVLDAVVLAAIWLIKQPKKS